MHGFTLLQLTFVLPLSDDWKFDLVRGAFNLPTSQALAGSKLRIGHNLPVLIFDELKHDLLLKTAGGPAAI